TGPQHDTARKAPMNETKNRSTINALVAAINGSDLAALDRVFTEDVVLEWPQSGERIEASLDYGDGEPYQCVFVFEMRDGLIAKETGYWSKPFPAPEWRAPWIERM
ncbi:MAG: hypothetical protein ACREMF_06525, partial [Gemmatimonadales bacterium]